MRQSLISVIMPVYNTGEVLADTVQSVLNQTFQDFELILVDDGSTDSSGMVCDFFAEKDSRVIVIHKKNGGICDARNAGLERASGQYITFCDHDDLYLPTLLQTEWEIANTMNADMVVVGKTMIEGDTRTEVGSEFCYSGAELKAHTLEILQSRALICIWNILYRRDILQGMQFNTQYQRGHEDFSFNLDVLFRANTICSVAEPLYVHIVRRNLSTSAKVYREAVPAMVETFNKTYHTIQESGIDMHARKYDIVRFLSGEIRCCLAYAVKAGLNYQEFSELTKKYEYLPDWHFFKMHDTGLKNRIVYMLLSKKWNRLLYLILIANSIKMRNKTNKTSA